MKKIAIVLATAAMFDLGAVVVSSHAAQADHFLKIDGVKSSSQYKSSKATSTYKFYNIPPPACRANGGEVVKNTTGQQACKTTKAIPGAVEFSATIDWGDSSPQNPQK
jgi:hypothetical protein